MRVSARSRASIRASTSDWDDDDPMTLLEFAEVFGDQYPITVSAMRTEIGRGRLAASKVGGSYFVTPKKVKALFQCPAQPKVRGSISARVEQTRGVANASQTGGSSEMDRLKSAQAAALNAWETPRNN